MATTTCTPFNALLLDNSLLIGNNCVMSDSPSAVDQLRKRMADLGWSQIDVVQAVRRMGVAVSAAAICRIVAGDRLPWLELAVAIQRSELGVHADAWIELGADETGPHPAVIDADTALTRTG